MGFEIYFNASSPSGMIVQDIKGARILHKTITQRRATAHIAAVCLGNTVQLSQSLYTQEDTDPGSINNQPH